MATMKILFAAFVLAAAPLAALADTPASSDPAPADRYLERDAAPPHRGCGPRADGQRPTADGRTHGEADVQIGSDGSKAAGAVFCAPIGETGEASVAVSRREGGRWRPPFPDGTPPAPDDR